MLLAEIQGKLRGSFDCENCGEEGAIAPGASAGIEDALTSTVFGAMRWLRPELGILPLLRRLELPSDDVAIANIQLWPRAPGIPLLELGRAEITLRGCEPDAFIDIGEQAFVLMEAKRGWGKDLGLDPLQLPKEAIVAHLFAKGRPWRLLCVTSGTTAPSIPGFAAEDGRLVQVESMPLKEAVASYFKAAALLGCHADWPPPEDVHANTCWLSWSSIGHMFQTSRSQSATLNHEAALLEDLVAYLEKAGHLRPPFHGFNLRLAPRLAWDAGMIWRDSASDYCGFARLPAKAPKPWPKLRWFSHI